jgi:hypothetical protein
MLDQNHRASRPRQSERGSHAGDGTAGDNHVSFVKHG